MADLPDGWIKGWTGIKRFMGGYRTLGPIKDMQENYGLPIRVLPTGEPVIVISEVNRWLQEFSDASSPFRIKKLVGAALRVKNGIKVGALKNNKKEHEDLMFKTFPGGIADLTGGVPCSSSVPIP